MDLECAHEINTKKSPLPVESTEIAYWMQPTFLAVEFKLSNHV